MLEFGPKTHVKKKKKLDLKVQAYNSSAMEVETGGFLGDDGQPVWPLEVTISKSKVDGS